MSPAPALNGEEEVERAARAMWEADGRHPDDWGTSTLNKFVAEQGRLRRLARAALAARRPATEAEARPRIYDELADNDLPNLLGAIRKLAEVRGWSAHEALWSVINLTIGAAADGGGQ